MATTWSACLASALSNQSASYLNEDKSNQANSYFPRRDVGVVNGKKWAAEENRAAQVFTLLSFPPVSLGSQISKKLGAIAPRWGLHH